MAISTQIQNLNLIPGKSAPVVVHLSQGNVGNTVQFYLYDGDNPYYPTNVSIAVHGVRADGSVFGPYAVSITSGSNLVSFNIVSAMTSVNGAAIGELVITDSSQNQIGSANFGMLVEETPYSSSVTYEDDLSIYQRILAYVQSIPAELRNEINTERDTRAAAINNLQTQINQIIAPSGEAPSAAEVQNARIGVDGTVYDTLGSAIRGQITDLKSHLGEIIDFTGGKEIEYFNEYITGDSYVPNTIKAFYDVRVPKNTIIGTVNVPVGSVGNNGTITVDVWELDDDNDTLSKAFTKTVTPIANSLCSIPVNKYSSKHRYVSVLQRSIQIYYRPNQTGHKFLASYNISPDTLSLSGLTPFNNMILIGGFDYYVKVNNANSSQNIVHIGNGYQFEEIQGALDAVSDSESNPYTFIIHPKSVPYNRFSMIRKLTGTYPWTNAPIRYISMIGIDKYNCVVKDATGDYSAPPAEILTNGLIKNLSFVATHENQSATASKGAYAVHIDAEPVGNVGYDMQFEDCYFESDQTAGVGVGLHNASHLTFKNCEFVSTGEGSYNPHSEYTNIAYLGAFNCHSSTKTSDTDQVLTLENCTAISKESKAYTLATNTDCYMTLKAYNNTLWCEGTGQANGYKGSYCTIYGANHGNNAESLNA